jgi:hypothetical protein
MNESDTPRTDAQATGNSDPQQDEYEDLLYFTRTLERELTVARAELAEWHDAAESVKAEYPDEVHCTCVPILRKQIKTLTEQRDEALSDLEFRRDLYKLQTKLLDDVREQRDDLLRYNEAFRNETLICADCDSISKGEYDQAIEQRDRLQKIVDEQCRVSSVCREYREQRDRLAEAVIRFSQGTCSIHFLLDLAIAAVKGSTND